jgi:hypothetical protein
MFLYICKHSLLVRILEDGTVRYNAETIRSISQGCYQKWCTSQRIYRFGHNIRQTREAKIIKVRYFAVYNVVIGRPTVADLRDVISTLHLTMIYPVGDGMVGVVKTDMDMAKKCYHMCALAF